MSIAPAPVTPQTLALWPDGGPGSAEWAHDEPECERAPYEAVWTVWNVTRPTLTPHLPDPAVATGTGIVVCPGGGFEFLVMGKEGLDIAQWLTARGIAAFVLKYRLERSEASVALLPGARTLRCAQGDR